MDAFIDPRRRAAIAIVALGVHIAAEVATIATSLAAGGAPPTGGLAMAIDLLAVVQFVALVAAVVTVALWVYRVSVNAHAFADGLSITPGWSVGWFFVPVANLFRPFEAIKETWQASEEPDDWGFVPVPLLLRLWWGCWLASNLASNLAFQLGRRGVEPLAASPIALIASALSALSAALLIRIVLQLSPAQRRAHAARVFA